MEIVHIDLDAFYAAVEMRDNPKLKGKPVIIGALPGERGVVATCSYEARKYGVRSAMSVQEAYKRCPHGVYMHPDMEKYKEASRLVHKIWADYTDICEYVSLDEGFLDVTQSASLFGGAKSMAHEIKRRTKEEVGITCSVGVGYSMMSAKLASEEKKPDGFFEILSPAALRELIIDRNVRVIYGVGEKTAERLKGIGVTTVRHIYENPGVVSTLLGRHGGQIVELAQGTDRRKVVPDAEAKSLGTEQTFQKDTADIDYIKDFLLLNSQKLGFDMKRKGLYAKTITLKATYADMKSVTRSKSGDATDDAAFIYDTAVSLLDEIEKRPVRLVGITLGNLTKTRDIQISMFDEGDKSKEERLNDTIMELQLKYGRKIIKPASVLGAEKRIGEDD